MTKKIMELLCNNYLKKPKTLITLSRKAISLGNRLHRKGTPFKSVGFLELTGGCTYSKEKN